MPDKVQMSVQMTEEAINSQITESVGGNYLLSEGELSPNGRYYVTYVGRTNDLRTRLKQHLSDGVRYLRAWYTINNSEEERYLQECSDYHEYSKIHALHNNIHPAKPEGRNAPCPICKQ